MATVTEGTVMEGRLHPGVRRAETKNYMMGVGGKKKTHLSYQLPEGRGGNRIDGPL